MSLTMEQPELVTTDSDGINPTLDNKQISNNLTDNCVDVADEQLNVAPVDSTNSLSENNEKSNSADSDNESLSNRTIKNKKKHHLIDSDSEDEPTTRPDPDSGSEKENLTPDEIHTPGNKKKSRLRKMSDDSDSETEANKSGEINCSPKESHKIKETVLSEINNAEEQKSRLNQLVDSDSEDESKLEEQLINENEDEDALQKAQAVRLKNLCDSESSADERETQNSPEIKTKKIQKSRKKSEPLAEKKMTGRDAMEQRRQIKSESQKMVREGRVSLPYHLPKQHTLQEFLKRRSLMPSVIHSPVNTSTTFAIKMSAQDLVNAAERMKESEKEIEEFYKSDSDDVDDNENETTEENKKESKVVEQKTAETNEESQDKPRPEENNETSDIIGEIDSILESGKQPSEQDNPTEPEVDVEKQSSEENIISSEKPNEDAAKIEELRSVLIQYSCDTDSKIEQLVEELEKMDCSTEVEEQIPQNPETSENPETTKHPETTKQPETSENPEISKNPETSENPETTKHLETSETPEEVVDLTEEQPPEKLTEDYIDSHFTANFRSVEETETPKETPNKEDEIEKKLRNLNPILSLKKDFTPRLTGDGGDFIVLGDSLERSKGVNDLMKRFLMHTTSNKPAPKKDTPQAERAVHQDTSLIEMDHEPDEAAKKNLTPGLKFKKLKANLEEQILQKRMEEWKKKQEEFRIETGAVDGEKTECGLQEKILDEEDEEDMSEEESSEDSEEEEEDDVVLADKPKVKSAFVDDEAEESDEEDNVDAATTAAVADDDEDEDSEDSDAESTDDLIKETGVKKPLKRIIQVFDDDSDDEETKGPEENDEEITVYQPQRNGLEQTPCKTTTEIKNDLSTFLTPTFHLTALQGMNSTTKSLNESPGLVLSPDPSPLRMHPLLKTKLFTEPEDANLEELENMCSGKFTGPTQPPKQINKDLTTQENDLLNLCSGKFTGLLPAEADAPQKTSEAPEEDNQFQITFDNDSLDEKLSESTSDIRTSQNSENTQNVLNAEPEEAPEVEATQTDVPLQFGKLNVTKFVIASSDEDVNQAEDTGRKAKSKKTKTKKKYIIDDISISEDEDTANQNDFSDDENENENENVEGEEEPNMTNVNYDSEENEVEFEEMEEIEADRMTAKKARDYFEAEAELSGSDWDSADEDEKGLDDFEAEDGDADKISEKKLQRELGRIHAHTVLEEDKRDVRLLQELLLEDGELHGAGREKKFKWKNADSATWTNENGPQDDDDDEIEEIENELEWRKMRHEREKFLKEQQSKQQKEEYEEILANDSQIMQLGKTALEKSISTSNFQQNTSIAEPLLTDADIKLPFTLTHKRGSFLTRSETTLARLADMTRTTLGALGSGPKNTRNFVFTTVDKTETETLIVEESSEKKRKAEPGTPQILKKMRIAESPAAKNNKKLF